MCRLTQISRNLLLGVALAASAATPWTTATLHAQTVTGAITGTITDPSGAVVPGAHVTAHNVATGVDSATTTNGSGFYRIEFLPIGRYTVAVDAAGFSKESLPAFDLEVLQTATFNVKLTVGDAGDGV